MEKDQKHEEKKEHNDSHDQKHHESKDKCKDGGCCCGMAKKNKPLLVLAAVVVLLIAGFLIFKPTFNNKNELSLEDAKVKAEKFINDNFSDPAYPIKVVSIEEAEEDGLYKLKIDVGGGEIIDSYISNDGKKFFPQAFDMAELKKDLGGEVASTSPEVVSDSNVVSEEGFNEGANFESEKKVAIYFFWGDGCPYCAKQKEAMVKWLEKYPNIEIKTYETWNNTDNRGMLESLAAAYDTTIQGVPMTFIGDKYWVGYADTLETEMISKIDECLTKTCENPGKRIQ
ncbi:hypothetical protein CVU82_03770 [Candidatus Falkowbacteria bacterium HGW-Falkowbacteria-1]|jgi:thiol-disulfide isomerase/thioredoxin/cell division protein FtsL|uniref:Thioredoxin domain-containing protein n=1 Tax=Candidatus Falkowbacteria bacterium HGW-Falkowbacteria-1 TaxID=2013768 RepID=A0A2N2E8S3_9BACT|nr:MAG: hypothetical protein CVU82_03770 [Candidatus Falkowbacteria bacterium HGW-Falkowbacteria-1]